MRSIRTLALALLAVAMPLAANALELVAPSRGVTLRGGTVASIEWNAGSLPKGAVEWEAFLSIDGGHYYGYRITPHLDIGIRRFSFLVPNVDTTRARIMIRTGDEERETRFEMPESFSIARDPHAAGRLHALFDRGRAESARDGDPAVLEWADGSRDGSGLSERAVNAEPKRVLIAASNGPDETATTLAPDSSNASPRLLTIRRRPAVASPATDARTEPRVLDLLLVCSRLNV